jgi:hypothetical protein
MLKQLQFAIHAFIATADVRSYHWCLVRKLRRRPTTENIEDAILCRHQLRQQLDAFLDSEDPRLWSIASDVLWPMLESLNQAIPEAEERVEG